MKSTLSFDFLWIYLGFCKKNEHTKTRVKRAPIFIIFKTTLVQKLINNVVKCGKMW